MIVVDSSVWIDSIRGASTPQVTQLQRAFRADEVLVGDLVLLEVLRGARHDRDAQRLERTLRQFAVVPMMSEAIAQEGARIYRTLRADGITIGKTVDLIIATFCLMGDHHLLHSDRDFTPIAERFGLRLA